jgi:hypothetical protein
MGHLVLAGTVVGEKGKEPRMDADERGFSRGCVIGEGYNCLRGKKRNNNVM